MLRTSLVLLGGSLALTACLDPDAPDTSDVTVVERRVDPILDRVIRLDYKLPLSNGRRIAVTETFTPRALLRFPHRAMLMIPSQGSNRSTYNAPFPGYDGGEELARAGFFAFTVDPEGSGDSTYPSDGFTVTYESEAATLHQVARYLQLARGVPRLDIFGEEVGGGVAMHLCADPTLARSCTMASMIYKQGSEFFTATVGGPEFQGFVFGAPSGYFTTFPELYFNVLAGASPELAAWFLSTQGGRYSAGTYVQDFERLLGDGTSYDPRHAAVPGLVLMGENDPNPAAADADQLAADYGSLGGGTATVEVVPGGTHIFRLDAAPQGAPFWSRVLAFVE